jgi:hypothetical protein
MVDSNPPDARMLAECIDSSSPWQDAKNDTKKLEAERTLMEFDTLDGSGLVAATPSFSQMADTLDVAIVMLC